MQYQDVRPVFTVTDTVQTNSFLKEHQPCYSCCLPLVLNLSGKGADPEKVPSLITDVLHFTKISLFLRGCMYGRYTRPGSMDFKYYTNQSCAEA